MCPYIELSPALDPTKIAASLKPLDFLRWSTILSIIVSTERKHGVLPLLYYIPVVVSCKCTHCVYAWPLSISSCSRSSGWLRHIYNGSIMPVWYPVVTREWSSFVSLVLLFYIRGLLEQAAKWFADFNVQWEPMSCLTTRKNKGFIILVFI